VSEYAALSFDELDQKISRASERLQGACSELYQYTLDTLQKHIVELLPLCEEMIRRYKRQGVATEPLPNGMSGLDAYFYSKKLNYSTIRGWLHRYRDRMGKGDSPDMAEMFKVRKPSPVQSVGSNVRRAMADAKQSGASLDEALVLIDSVLPEDPYSHELDDAESETPLTTLAERLCREVEYLYSPKPLPKKLATLVEKIRAQQSVLPVLTRAA
jgi:hypothetical protein